MQSEFQKSIRILSLLCLLITSSIYAFGTADEVKLLPIEIDLHDQAKLQRGAQLFMNYCSGCHSLRYLRYNRMAFDLGLVTFDGELDTDLLRNNLIFTHANENDPIEISMPATDARQWFGVTPPDLSLKARERGAAWLYTYLKSFYADPARPFGTNNLLIPNVAMPNVLAPLAGEVIAVKEKEIGKQSLVSHLVLVSSGRMNEQEFNSCLQDLVTFLVYVGEPAKLIRYRIGIPVLVFLSIFLFIAYRLKRIYWKNIRLKTPSSEKL